MAHDRSRSGSPSGRALLSLESDERLSHRGSLPESAQIALRRPLTRPERRRHQAVLRELLSDGREIQAAETKSLGAETETPTAHADFVVAGRSSLVAKVGSLLADSNFLGAFPKSVVADASF